MRKPRTALLCLAAIAGLTLAAGDAAVAQQKTTINRAPTNTIGRAPTNVIGTTPSRGGGNEGGSYQGGGYRGGIGWGAAVPGVLMTLPQSGPSRGDVFIDDGSVNDGPRGQPPQRTSGGRPSGAPPANERRLIPDEVVMELSNSVSPQTIDALQRRFRLERIEQQSVQLTGSTFYRWRIRTGARSPPWCARLKPTVPWPRRSRTTCSGCKRMRPKQTA